MQDPHHPRAAAAEAKADMEAKAGADTEEGARVRGRDRGNWGSKEGV